MEWFCRCAQPQVGTPDNICVVHGDVGHVGVITEYSTLRKAIGGITPLQSRSSFQQCWHVDYGAPNANINKC